MRQPTINPVQITPENRHFFFGYYDKTPYNSATDKVLAMETKIFDRLPIAKDSIDIGYFSTDGQQWQWHKLLETVSWNFQQGCMLQWLSDYSIVCNTFDNNKLYATVLATNGDIIKELPKPIYSVSNNKQFAMSVSFGRLHKYREGYGYNQNLQIASATDDGIFKICLQTNKSELIINYQKFIDLGYLDSSSSYWIDHILHSPDDEHIAFLLRNIETDDSTVSKVFICKNDGSNLKCLLNSNMASHACWYDKQHFTIWGRTGNITKSVQQLPAANLLKPVFNLIRTIGIPNFLRKNLYGDSFLSFDINTGTSSTFADKIPANDGGGHYTFNKDWMVCDIMPNKQGLIELFLYNKKTDKKIVIDRLFIPEVLRAQGYRCDLHPRWSSDFSKIIIDSSHQGYRGMYYYDVKDLIS